MFPTKTLLFTLALTAVACAPRVSKRAPESHQAAAVAQAQPVAVAPVLQARPAAQPQQQAQPQQAQPQPAAKAQPVAVVEKDETPPIQKAKLEQPMAVKAEPAVERDEASEESGEGYAHEEPKAAASSKKSFYSYSDEEITAMRRRSREFKKLHNQLNSCTSKSERVIAKREQLRDKIIALQNTEYRTPRQDKELNKLRADERKMLSGRAENASGCQELEVRLTEMLKTYASQGA